MTEDQLIGWHHQLDGCESEQAPGDGEGQGSLVCCSPWGHKESNTTERLGNNTSLPEAGPSFGDVLQAWRPFHCTSPLPLPLCPAF